jgi:hypothetical protein
MLNMMGTVTAYDIDGNEVQFEIDIIAKDMDDFFDALDLILDENFVDEYKIDLYEYHSTVTDNAKISVPQIDN